MYVPKFRVPIFVHRLRRVVRKCEVKEGSGRRFKVLEVIAAYFLLFLDCSESGGPLIG